MVHSSLLCVLLAASGGSRVTSVGLDGRDLRPDFVDRPSKVVIEAQSFRWHATPENLQRDAHKRNMLARMGYMVMEYTCWDAKRESARVRAEVDTVVASRLPIRKSAYVPRRG
jgi:hypothetical protein